MKSRTCRSIVAAIVTCLALGCGGEGPVDPADNAALNKPRPGMEDMKQQMLEAMKKSKRVPAKVPPNLLK